MLLQQSPFRGEDEDEIYDAILADEPLYPIHMPRDSVSILQKLLMREPELRLGSGPTDAQEIMSHAFFRNINWDDIRDKKVTPPFMPQISSATDTSNFDSEFTSVTPVLTPVQSGMISYPPRQHRTDRLSSSHPGDARRVPGLLLFGRFHLRLSRICIHSSSPPVGCIGNEADDEGYDGQHERHARSRAIFSGGQQLSIIEFGNSFSGFPTMDRCARTLV